MSGVDQYVEGHNPHGKSGPIAYVNIDIDGEDTGLCIETPYTPRHGETVQFGCGDDMVIGVVDNVEHVFSAYNGLRRHYYIINVNTHKETP